MASSHQFTVTISGDCSRDAAHTALSECLFGETPFAQVSGPSYTAAEYVGTMLDRFTGDTEASITISD